MSRFYSYLNTSAEIITRYTGDQPLSGFLKNYFATAKKHGSKDRKQISHLCYCYFRTGKLFSATPIPDVSTIQFRILAGLFLCSSQTNEILHQLKPEWNDHVGFSIEEKCGWLNTDLHPADARLQAGSPSGTHFSPLFVFPWKAGLSEGIDHSLFCRSFLIQPDLFIRIRPDNQTPVRKKLTGAGIPHRVLNEYCIAFVNNTKLESVIIPDKEAVIQDYSSQQVASFLQMVPVPQTIAVWDCCAASGGKSILAKDILRQVSITVSDIRKSVLVNLEKRFAAAGINNYTRKVIDLTQPPAAAPKPCFDLIICDVPCSGSGTWARTPEQLHFWKEEEVLRHAATQKKILAHVVPFLKKGGHLLYITCSVFKEENENIVHDCVNQQRLKLLKMEILKGYDKKADTMFAALLINSPETEAAVTSPVE